MTQFEYHNAANDEASERKALAYLLAQVSQGKAATGVLSGLGVTQTGTASSSVIIGAGAGVLQAATTDGASILGLDAALTYDVLGPNPMGALPRNDIIVFDQATLTTIGAGGSGGVRAVIGTPNASPTDPTIPTSCIPLARLRHAASATTVPTAKIDDLRTYTGLAGARVNAKIPFWAPYTTSNLDGSGYATVTHGAGFTPTAVFGSSSVTTFASSQADAILSFDSFTSTTFRVRAVKSSTSAVITGVPISFTAFLGQ